MNMSSKPEQLTHFPVGAVVFPDSCLFYFVDTTFVRRALEQNEPVLLLGRLHSGVPCCRVLTCRGEIGDIVEAALLSESE